MKNCFKAVEATAEAIETDRSIVGAKHIKIKIKFPIPTCDICEKKPKFKNKTELDKHILTIHKKKINVIDFVFVKKSKVDLMNK